MATAEPATAAVSGPRVVDVRFYDALDAARVVIDTEGGPAVSGSLETRNSVGALE